MKSIGYPKIFENSGSSSTIVVEDKKATKNNIKLLLGSEKGEMLGDPFYGIRLKAYMFDQNNRVLKDLIIDEIYSAIKVFIPQVTVNRKDIDLYSSSRGVLTGKIRVIYNVDYSVENMTLVLMQEEE